MKIKKITIIPFLMIAITIITAITAGCDDIKNLQQIRDSNKILEESIKRALKEKNKISDELNKKISELKDSQEKITEITAQKNQIEKQLTAALSDKDQLKIEIEKYKAQAEEYKRKIEARQKLFEN